MRPTAASLVLILCLAACTGGRPGAGRAPSEAPAMSPSFDLQGHRGARGLLPENTLPAFLRALELGVTTLEMDASVTKDGQVVLSHEPWFSGVICLQPSGVPVPREAERSFRIYEMTYDEVARFDCGSRGHPSFPGQQRVRAPKPLLRDVLAAAEAYTREHGRPPVRYNIETKSRPAWDGLFHPEPEAFTRLLYDAVVEAGVLERTTLQSFDPRTLRAGRALDRAWSLALLVEAGGDPGLDANLQELGFTPEIYSPDYRLVDRALVDRAHELGMAVIPWTVNDASEMRRLIALGVDGLITDYPDVGVQVVGAAE